MARKVPDNLIIKLYRSEASGRLDREVLFEVASRLDVLAQEVPSFDEEDHDWGKDAGKFHHAYVDACRGSYPKYLRYASVEAYLMQEVDTLLSGCHSDVSMADYYLVTGSELLDRIFKGV